MWLLTPQTLTKRSTLKACRSVLVSRTGASPLPHVTATATELQSFATALLRWKQTHQTQHQHQTLQAVKPHEQTLRFLQGALEHAAQGCAASGRNLASNSNSWQSSSKRRSLNMCNAASEACWACSTTRSDVP